MAQAKTTAKSKAKTAPKAAAKSSAKPAKTAPKAAKPAAKAAASKKPAAKKPAAKAASAKKPAAKAAPKAAAPKTTAAKTAAKPAAQPKAPAKPAAKPAAKKPAKKLPFARGDYVVYPTHGVGKVTGVEKQEIAGFNLQLFVILFESEKMTLRVPVEKVADSGLRKISSKDKMMAVMGTLKGRARSKRTMWSRRAQEYEAKINSGDPVAIAEVVRDLYRAPGQPEQSYSERQMYEAALERLVNEYALVEKLDVDAATQKLETVLSGA
jgi:CarD family transcriptional regulator